MAASRFSSFAREEQVASSADERRKKKKGKKEARPSVGIRWMILGSLALFIVFMMVVLWIFQVRLLDVFYERSINKGMERAAQEIGAVLGDDDATEDAVYQYADQYSVCAMVYRIESGLGRVVATADVSNDCIIHHVTGSYISTLYVESLKNGGECRVKVQLRSEGILSEFEHQSNGNATDDPLSTTTGEFHSGPISALLVKVVHGADGKEYVLLLDAELTPVTATGSTLRLQFSLIALILLIGVLVLAYILSRRISRPIIQMNQAAKQLAQGKYDAQFSGGGYRETSELAATLNYASEELSKVDRLQKELIANISHDLRTPLTMITGYSEVMRDLPGENTPENVQVIIDEANHLSALVNDLLDLSRVQSGFRRMEPECFNLTQTVRDTIGRYDKLTHHEGYTVVFEAETEIEVRADRSMILQVLYNLINNAINYCGADKTVCVRQLSLQEHVRICVTDHGEGIPPDQLSQIWDRYYKVDRVHRRAMVGTGLGLSIVKGILEMHGAGYGVESTPGQGSTFWFDLPVAPPEQAEIVNEITFDTENDP